MRDVATSATTIRTMAPTRSDQGARLKNSHHTTTANPPTTPPSIAERRTASGTTMGTTNQTSHCSTTATTPGHSRSGLARSRFVGLSDGHIGFSLPTSGSSVHPESDWFAKAAQSGRGGEEWIMPSRGPSDDSDQPLCLLGNLAMKGGHLFLCV